jgi:putative transposase
MNRSINPYKRHRFPPAIIRYAVWLYHRFNPSHRDIEDLLAERGIEASYESVATTLPMASRRPGRRRRRRVPAGAQERRGG